MILAVGQSFEDALNFHEDDRGGRGGERRVDANSRYTSPRRVGFLQSVFLGGDGPLRDFAKG